MDIEKTRRLLELNRVAFRRLYDVTLGELKQSDPNLNILQGNMELIQEKVDSLIDLDKQFINLLLESDSTEEEIDNEVEIADKIRIDYNKLRFEVGEHILKNSSQDVGNIERSSISVSSNTRLNLPKIEFRKFSGDIKDWILFWSQFKRIHDDETLENEDKFQYLIQATVPKSRARQLIESYPPTSENYIKAIDNLQSRFGREDLLVEYYSRELLKLVLNNFQKNIILSSLFDKLEAQLRALETLGVTTDKCSAMLLPIVESCLPVEILRAWQRNPYYDPNSDSKNKLEKLMSFMRKEVESEEKIHLAVSGFGNCGKKNKDLIETDPPATGIDLLNKKSNICIFCQGHHESQDCSEAFKMTQCDKRKLLSKKGYCHRCCRYGHISRRCKVKVDCQYCKGHHATSMCWKREESGKESSNLKNETLTENLSNSNVTEVILQTLWVKLEGKNSSKLARVLIDTGSQRSYITQKAANEMNYDVIYKEKMIHALFGGNHTESINHNCYKIILSNLNKKYTCNFNAYDQPVICSNILSIKQGSWIQVLQNLGVEVTDTRDGPIDILIGSDIAGKLFTGKKYQLSCGLVALETLLGWTLMGKMVYSAKDGFSNALIVTTLFSKNAPLSNLWDLDVLGITDPAVEKNKEEKEQHVMNLFGNSVKRNKDGRYQVSLLWLENHLPLPNNYDLAKKRLDNLMKKLEKDSYYQEYNKTFQEWKEEGIIELVPDDDIQVTNLGVHYLPHHHVIKLSSASTKLRPVFDASSRPNTNHPSLNQCLEKGNNLIELIPAILVRFRLYRIGVVADIRKAFLQIEVNEEDRDMLRFLWYDENLKLQVYRHTRVVFGLTCSPFLLGAVIKHHLNGALENNSFSSKNMQLLLNSFYVDNCVISLNDELELQNFIEQAQAVMQEAQFDLRAWEHSILDKEDTEIHISPVLGLLWNRNEDTIKISIEGIKNISTEKVTKRIILSVANRIFDPIGFTLPVSLCPKLLLRKTWILNLGWNKEVPEEIKKSFLEWLEDVHYLSNLAIPRWFLKVSPKEVKNWSVHLFCDASQDSYGAVIYLRTESNSSVSLQLVQARSRISPIKKISIPRLELLAASIGVRLLNSLLSNLSGYEMSIFCWTNSTTVLSWITRQEMWKPFVWNRVQEIRKFTDPAMWNHVPGKLNPADLLSRGCKSKFLLESNWWLGPSWLYKDHSDWPEQNYDICEENVAEEKRNISLLNNNSDVFDIWYERFSKYGQIVRLIGWIKRFSYNCGNNKNRKEGELSTEEILDAEKKVIWLIQNESFKGFKDDRLSSLQVFEDNQGILRLITKIVERDDYPNFRLPAVLPPKHKVVTRLIREQHLRKCHVGVQGLLNILRENFWILGGRKTIRKVIEECIICKKNEGKHLDADYPPLPVDRVKDAASFEITGVDLFGPMYLRDGQKVWVCIFTCAVYRAIHLELVASLSTYSFLQALRRFIARRGRPKKIYSDNGTNFVGTDNCFSALDWKKISEYSTAEKIIWCFNPPTAAWWGGWWERLIRLVKQLLKRVLGRASLTYEELATTLCDCEAVVNSRPLTYVAESKNELQAITPAFFLQDIQEIGTPDIDEVKALNGVDLRKRMRYRIKLKEDLKKRFRSEYLGQLILRKKKCQWRTLQVGDLVMIEGNNKNRLTWPLARVVEIFVGKDGNIRLAKVKSPTGILLRPIQRLYPLETMEPESNETLKEETRIVVDSNQEIDGPDCDEPVETEKVITRSGRVVKRPNRF